ncbi:molybdopterin molybdotransferase MoeA [Meridianimarinicoccus sp. RP-17]
MIPVSAALDAILALVAPLPGETVALRDVVGRVLAAPATAGRDQPPFDAAQMDGYALRSADLETGRPLRVVGTATAGHGFTGTIQPGEAVRIFTGAPVPGGADRVVMQEETGRQGDVLTVAANAEPGPFIRPRGGDFARGAELPAGRALRPADIALLAAMNVPQVTVHRRPAVAILSTGDELVPPGADPGPDQIVASNGYGLAALVTETGAEARLLPIARDSLDSLDACLRLGEGADLIVTTGGASVGDHDLLARDGTRLGIDLAFYKVAMRPGKPLMAGRLRGTPMLGLPGNPVSALVCGRLFAVPALRRLAGHPPEAAARATAVLGTDLPANGAREHYMRARTGTDGCAYPADSQDSSLLHILAQSDALIVRPPHDPPRHLGETVEIVKI